VVQEPQPPLGLVFSNYETLFCCAKPGFINPELLEQQDIALEDLLEEEALGMAFPVDSRYFDQFPVIYNEEEDKADVAGMQHPQPPIRESREALRDLVTTRYGEKDLEPKSFPHLHPWGFGGWYYKSDMSFSAHIKMRLFDVRGWYAEDPFTHSSSLITWPSAHFMGMHHVVPWSVHSLVSH